MLNGEKNMVFTDPLKYLLLCIGKEACVVEVQGWCVLVFPLFLLLLLNTLMGAVLLYLILPACFSHRS